MKEPSGPRQILRLLFWESTIRCNLTCAHCRRVESDNTAHRDMSTEQAKDLIEQLAELGRGQPMMPVLVFSGGEPLGQPGFLEDMLRRCRERDIHTVVDTCGFSRPAVLRAIATQTDLFLFDLKFMNPSRHRELTGVEREAASERYLAKHPHLKEFAASPNCALVEVSVGTFHVVTRFQEVVEIHVG